MNNVINFSDGIDEYPLEIIDANDDKWILAQQVGEALGNKNIRDLINSLKEKGELTDGKHICKVTLQMVDDTQPRKYSILSYRGIIRVSMRSEGERAILFRDWAEDVLYEVMTTGSYNMVRNDINRHLLDEARVIERTARIFRAIVFMARTAGFRSSQAIARGNMVTREKTGIDCLDLIGAPYLTEPDSIGPYISEQCEIKPDLVVSTLDLHDNYKVWCRSKDIIPVGRNTFFRELLAQYPDIERKPYGPDRLAHFVGIGFVSDAAPEEWTEGGDA